LFVQVLQIIKDLDSGILLDIRADSPAAFVWLETTINGRFEENGFLMNTPQKYVRVQLSPSLPLSLSISISISIKIYHILTLYCTFKFCEEK